LLGVAFSLSISFASSLVQGRFNRLGGRAGGFLNTKSSSACKVGTVCRAESSRKGEKVWKERDSFEMGDNVCVVRKSSAIVAGIDLMFDYGTGVEMWKADDPRDCCCVCTEEEKKENDC